MRSSRLALQPFVGLFAFEGAIPQGRMTHCFDSAAVLFPFGSESCLGFSIIFPFRRAIRYNAPR